MTIILLNKLTIQKLEREGSPTSRIFSVIPVNAVISASPRRLMPMRLKRLFPSLTPNADFSRLCSLGSSLRSRPIGSPAQLPRQCRLDMQDGRKSHLHLRKSRGGASVKLDNEVIDGGMGVIWRRLEFLSEGVQDDFEGRNDVEKDDGPPACPLFRKDGVGKIEKKLFEGGGLA